MLIRQPTMGFSLTGAINSAANIVTAPARLTLSAAGKVLSAAAPVVGQAASITGGAIQALRPPGAPVPAELAEGPSKLPLYLGAAAGAVVLLLLLMPPKRSAAAAAPLAPTMPGAHS